MRLRCASRLEMHCCATQNDYSGCDRPFGSYPKTGVMSGLATIRELSPPGVRFSFVESFRDGLLGIRRVVETRGLSRRIRIVDDKHPAAVRLAAHYLGAQPLRRRWWAERPCAMQYGQSFAGFDNGPCVDFHASAT